MGVKRKTQGLAKRVTNCRTWTQTHVAVCDHRGVVPAVGR